MEVRDQNGLTEAEFIRQYDPNRYEKPAVTVDMLIFTVNPEKDDSLELLMIERGGHPFLGKWAALWRWRSLWRKRRQES